MNRLLLMTYMFCCALPFAQAQSATGIEYPYVTAEPQKTGWPLTAEERAYIVDKPEHDRRPGRESNKHLPKLWPQVPSAGYFGGDAWLNLHEAHVKTVQANQGPLDVLLVGDSITIQWGDSWKKHFPNLKAVNIGIGGDKTQNGSQFQLGPVGDTASPIGQTSHSHLLCPHTSCCVPTPPFFGSRPART